MEKSNSAETRRRLLFAGGAGLFGITSVLAGWIVRARGPGRAQAEARRLAGRIDLPLGAGSMMKAFARDPEKVERFRELTRWRQKRGKELRKA
jgi:hypothetical protein